MSKTAQRGPGSYQILLRGQLDRLMPWVFTGVAMQAAAEENEIRAVPRLGEFFRSLPPDALSDFESLEYSANYSGNTILFLEGETPSRVLVLLEGKVKLSINSIDGKRLILRIAQPGEILALTSALLGCPYAITAETLHLCTIATLRRQDFLSFLLCHPIAYQGAARELSLDYTRACERLHTIGLKSSAQIRLARLLVEWCADGQQTGCGTRIKLSLTHREIGECIGCSRETVTRSLNDFKHQHLLDHHGATLLIPNRVALERYADVDRPRGSISQSAKSLQRIERLPNPCFSIGVVALADEVTRKVGGNSERI